MCNAHCAFCCGPLSVCSYELFAFLVLSTILASFFSCVQPGQMSATIETEGESNQVVASLDEVPRAPFLEGLRAIPPHASVSERYYKHKLYRNPISNEQSNQDLLVLAHSNRIVIITLAPTHDVLALGKTVRKVHFGTDKVNRLDNKVKGKWKKGAQKVQQSSVLCTIECEDGSTYSITACVTGKIVEINKRLIEQPTLLSCKPWSDGFVAIILPPFQSQEISNLEGYCR